MTEFSVKLMTEQLLVSTEAAKSALQATSDESLRVPCYCEENVWRLAYRKSRLQRSGEAYYVAFVSNPKGCVPMFEQLAAEDRDQPVSSYISLTKQNFEPMMRTKKESLRVP